MKRILPICLAIATMACSGDSGSLSSYVQPGAAQGFNLLLVTLDTTRADHLGAYGHPSAATPAIDRLAADGVRFEHAMASVPITLPSHATILTGLLPPAHSVRDNAEYRLSDDHLTLAEVLVDAGYQTAAFVSAFVLESRYGLDQGFEFYEDETGFGDQPSSAGRIVERNAETVTQVAVDWLENRDRDRPFFAWVHYFDPHMPYAPPAPYSTRFADAPYDGEIAYMDSQIGHLLQALARTGGRDRTIVVVLGDHGEGLGEHGEDSHAMLIYDSVMRVPFILHAPAIIRGPVVVEDDVVSTADLLPTLLDLLDVVDPAPRDGISLVAERVDPDRAVYLESLTPYLHHGWAPLFGLRGAADKLILAPISEYYDLRDDPSETTNLFAVAAGSAAVRRDALVEDLRLKIASGPSVDEVAASAENPDVETMQKLQALGYLSGGTPENPSLRDPKEMMQVLRYIHQSGNLLRQNRPEEALQTIAEAARLSPGDRTVLQIQGAVQLMMGNTVEAERAFREYLEIRPSADICSMLAQILIGDGRRDEAWELLDQAEQLDPHHGLIHLARGDLLSFRGRIDEAIASYERAATDDPTLSRSAEARIARVRR